MEIRPLTERHIIQTRYALDKKWTQILDCTIDTVVDT